MNPESVLFAYLVFMFDNATGGIGVYSRIGLTILKQWLRFVPGVQHENDLSLVRVVHVCASRVL